MLAVSSNVTVQVNDTFPLRIGAGATEDTGLYWFPGSVDDVRVYRVALDAPHVWAIFANLPVISSITRQSNGSMLLGASVSAGQTYVLLNAPRRGPGAAWAPVATNMADANGNVQFVDASASNYVQCFYRLVMP